jgi:hypothetical protein
MLKEIPELRAPENKRTGIEISPKVKCPDQTEAAMIFLSAWIREGHEFSRAAKPPKPFALQRRSLPPAAENL